MEYGQPDIQAIPCPGKAHHFEPSETNLAQGS
jgi:hypothetical protein